MSMIPAHVSPRLIPMAPPASGIKRLPRALGWLSAAIVSGGLWCAAIEAVRAVL
jgi:hypothetical protein